MTSLLSKFCDNGPVLMVSTRCHVLAHHQPRSAARPLPTSLRPRSGSNLSSGVRGAAEALSKRRVHGVHTGVLANGSASFQSRDIHIDQIRHFHPNRTDPRTKDLQANFGSFWAVWAEHVHSREIFFSISRTGTCLELNLRCELRLLPCV